jgi:hypothetical protein
MVRWLLALGLIVGCQGKHGDPGTGGGPGTGSAGSGADADDSGEPQPADLAALPPEDAQPVKIEEPELPDPGKVIDELGAIPPWQAVVRRAQLLRRRGQHGVVYGQVGPTIMMPGPSAVPTDAGPPIDAGLVASPYVWLVDDSDGNGTLGIRVKLDGKAADGARVALGGAWDLDEARRWFWRSDSVQPVPAAAPSDLVEPPTPVPTHEIATGPLPAGVRPISLAKDNDAISFVVVGRPPATEGDGWPIADELGDPVFALINLPGERASYGGQDMRQADERWTLRRGQTYWVRIGKVRKRGDGPVLVNARTAPIRVR